MPMKLQMQLRPMQTLVMTPALQQAIKLLQMSRLELQQTLSQHLTENPVLEEVDGIVTEEVDEDNTARFAAELYGGDWKNWSGRTPRMTVREDDVPYTQRVAIETTLGEHLLWQLNLSSLPEEEKSIGRLVIGNIDDDGYLRCAVEDIAAEARVPEARVAAIVRHVQGYDPMGVAARDLKECLLIQAEQLGLAGSIVWTIIDRYLPQLERRNYKAIAKGRSVGLHEIAHAVKIIEGMEPKPGRPFFNVDNQAIAPDVYVFRSEGRWIVFHNEDGMPRIRLHPHYERMYQQLLKEKSDDPDNPQSYLGERMRSARELVRSLDQRNRTIIRVAESIVKFQEPFFAWGSSCLKPLVLKQVADDLEIHESTVSRVTANKYMYTPHGIFSFKFFFTGSIPRTGGGTGEVSPVTVRELIRMMITEEDARKPLSDQEVVARLRGLRIALARRTVAKYRAELHIAPANQRKRVF